MDALRTAGALLREARRPRLELAGRAALVTGAGQGIGAAVARELHVRGARVALLDVDGEAVAAVRARLGGETLALEADVRDRAAMACAVASARDTLGSLDVVVANAGVTPRAASLRTIDPDEYDRVLAVNHTGMFNTVHPALDAVIETSGHVVVVASVAAFVPGVGGAPYMISKAAAEQLGRALRVELAAHGASAGVAYFGIVQTAMTRVTLDDDPIGPALDALLPGPLRRRISPERAARVLVDGIERRAASTMAPARWRAWALARGPANVVVDAVVAADPRLRQLLHELERRVLDERGAPVS